MMTLRRFTAGLARVSVLSICLVSIAGCTAPHTTVVDPLGGAPADFSLDVTVAGGDADEPGTTAGRFVLFADGTMHHADEPGAGPGSLPPRRRVLDRRQIAGVWSLLQQIGIDDSSAGDPVVNFNLIDRDRDEVIVMVAITGDDHRWMFVRTAPTTAEIDPGFDRLIRHLVALAWAGDDAPIHVAEPRRYDFGPDPYAPYR